MIITASLITAVKGALFLSKTAAAKALLVKAITAISSGVSVASVASSGVLVCTVVGYCETVRTVPKRISEGCTQIVKGIVDKNFVDFTDGLYHLSRAGMSAYSIMNCFNEFVDKMDAPDEIKFSLKQTFRSLEYQVLDTVEEKSYKLLKEVELSLKDRGFSEEKYVKEVKTIYLKHTIDLNDDYEELKGRAGRIYSDICKLNESYGIGTKGEYDHYLVYCIAGWFIDNLKLECLNRIYSSDKTMMQRRLARDITDQILAYLKAYKLN